MTGFAVQLPRIGVFKILRGLRTCTAIRGKCPALVSESQPAASDSAIAPSADISGMAHFSPFGPAAAASSRCARRIFDSRHTATSPMSPIGSS